MASVGTIIMLLQYLKDGHPGIYMPPLLPPPSCESKLITRADDTEEVVKERLRVYHDKSYLLRNSIASEENYLDLNCQEAFLSHGQNYWLP